MLIVEAIDIIKDKEQIDDQYSIAQIIGVSQGTISNYLKGDKYPNLSVAGNIYLNWELVVEPFTERAVKREAEYLEEYGTR